MKVCPRASYLRATADKILAKLNSWETKVYVNGRDLCLLQSVIFGSTVHSMKIYKWPRSLIKEVELAMRNFLWIGVTTSRSSTTVK